MRGMTLSARKIRNAVNLFQSTSPYAGDDDSYINTVYLNDTNFNPHPPMRGMTGVSYIETLVGSISIHIPLCGG